MVRRRKSSPPRRRVSRRTAASIGLGAVVIALYATLVPLQTLLYGTPLPISFLLGAALASGPLLAISRPRRAILLFCAASFTLPLIVDPQRAVESPWPWSVPALLLFVLFVGVVTFLHGARIGVLPLVIGAAGSLAAPLLRPDMVALPVTAGSATADLIVTASVGTAALLIAALMAARRRVAAELTREKEHSALEQSRRALIEERTRIARELHDVVAHTMSVIQVQASTARYRLPGIDESVAAEFDDIAATTRASLAEMRRMLGVLRTEDQSAELAPQQGIDDIPGLVDSIRRAGVEIGLVIEGGKGAADAATGVQIAAFRIVQEALSNAVRHAPGARVEVRLHADGTVLRIRVHNARSSQTTGGQGTGYGLRGMRERAELLGGSLSAGPDADGGWTVEATLPVRPDADATPADARNDPSAAPEGAR